MNRKLRRRTAKAGPEQALADAFGHFQGGRSAEAESILRRIQRTYPGNPDVLHLLAVIALQTARGGEAVDYLQQAIAAAPKSAQLYDLLGSALDMEGQSGAALDAFAEAIALDPGLSGAHYNRANALHKLERLAEAVAGYEKALVLEPDFADAHFNLGNILRDGNELEKAAAAYHRCRESDPGFADIFMYLGDVHRMLGELAEAEADFRRVIETKPDSANAYSGLGRVLSLQGKVQESVACHQRAFSLRTGIRREISFAGNEELFPGTFCAFIELTNKCNFHCEFCPSDIQQRPVGFMATDMVRKIIDEITEKKLARQVELHLMGEPTLHPDFYEILAYGAAKNIEIELVTNGSTLSAKTIPRIMETLFGTIVVSLQTPTRETFKHRGEVGLTWDRYIGNIRLLVREHLKRLARKEKIRCKINIRMMVTKNSYTGVTLIESAEDIRAVANEWRDFITGVEQELGMAPFERREIDPKTILDAAGKGAVGEYHLQQGVIMVFWAAFTFANSRISAGYDLRTNETPAFCPQPFLDLVILWNGDVTLCCMDYDGRLVVGNVRDRSLESVLTDGNSNNLRAGMLARRPLPAFCGQCQAKPDFPGNLPMKERS